MSVNELACVYAALILQDDDVAITSEKIQTILKTANVDVEPYWPGLFAKALENVDVKALITNVGSGVGSGPAAGATMAAAADAGAAGGGDAAADSKDSKKKEKEAEPESEEDDDMGFGLFD